MYNKNLSMHMDNKIKLHDKVYRPYLSNEVIEAANEDNNGGNNEG